MTKKPTKAQIDRAVKALRLYNGSFDFCSIRCQQRLYDRFLKAMKPLEAVGNAYEQIADAAGRMGPIRPAVGKDI